MNIKRTSLIIGTIAAALIAVAPNSSEAKVLRFNEAPQVGDVLPGGYFITHSRGANRYIAKRNNRTFFVQGNNATYLDPRYPIQEQIDLVDLRKRRYRGNN